METLELKKLLREIGDSVHSMNTIAVGLSKLKIDNCDIPEGLDISWKPKDLDKSKKKARRYAEKAAVIYSVESFFEYLESISTNPLWIHDEINFKGDDKKAQKVHNFLSKIPAIKRKNEFLILSELACHWRNKIVHSNASRAKLSSNKIDKLKKMKEYIYDNYHHFDIDLALKNYEEKKITLKDSSTLITFLIKSARLIDEFFFRELSLDNSSSKLVYNIYEKSDFIRIFKQQDSEKRDRQISTYIYMNFPFLDSKYLEKIIDKIKTKPRP